MQDNLQIQPAPQACLVELWPSVARPRKRRVEEKPHADFLNLPNVICRPFEPEPGEPEPPEWVIFVEAEQVGVPTYPDCRCAIKEVEPYGTFAMEEIYDLPWGRKCVVFNLRRRRWRCKTCKKRTATQPAEFLAAGRYHMTQRLLEYLQVHSLFESELQLSKETGVPVRKIREIRDEFVGTLEKQVKFGVLGTGLLLRPERRVPQNTIYCCGEIGSKGDNRVLGLKILSILLRKACRVGYQTSREDVCIELIILLEVEGCNSKSHFTRNSTPRACSGWTACAPTAEGDASFSPTSRTNTS